MTISQKNILHHKILESYTELSELIQIPSSVTFAVFRSLVLKSSRKNCSINWQKVEALVTAHCLTPRMNIYGLANLA